jgi:hypothetical protein
LFGPRLISWEALLQRLANIQLTYRKDEFRWNLHENGKLLVASMYNALVETDLPVDRNKKTWKMKIPQKTKNMHGICVKELFLLKIIFFSKTGIKVRHVFFVLKMRQ